MTERSYSTIDKADWGDGPWQHEPDKCAQLAKQLAEVK